MLFSRGTGTVQEGWQVKESSPASYCRIYYVRAGHVIYQDDRTNKQLKSGHLYVFPSTQPYEMHQDPADPLNCLYLHVDITPHILDELLELTVEEGSFLQYLLETMEKWIAGSARVEIDAVMEQLATSLVAYLVGKDLLPMVPEKLAKTISYITSHVSEKITVDTLSELCGYHTQYYIRLFCAHLGTTPHQYLVSYRMKLAISLILEGKSVSETADLVGYPELRNFIRAFKKYYGYSPGQVKKYMYLDF